MSVRHAGILHIDWSTARHWPSSSTGSKHLPAKRQGINTCQQGDKPHHGCLSASEQLCGPQRSRAGLRRYAHPPGVIDRSELGHTVVVLRIDTVMSARSPPSAVLWIRTLGRVTIWFGPTQNPPGLNVPSRSVVPQPVPS